MSIEQKIGLTNPLNHVPNQPQFLLVCKTSLLKTLWEKGEIDRNEQFLLFPHSVFYPLGQLSAISIKFKTVVCKLFQIRRI